MTTRIEFCKAVVEEKSPAPFDSPIKLRLVLELYEKVPRNTIDVQFIWSPIWDFDVDQELDELEVGPFTTLGRHEIELECDPPNVQLIPDPTGPTALLVKLKYNGEQFLHLGFNVVVTCKGDIPDTFTSPELLYREIGRCISRAQKIQWDEEVSIKDNETEEISEMKNEVIEPEIKKFKADTG